ncbi:LysR substrate-binding domain-containing protein [Marinobacter oulmenensis]|uniref:LysR substrate-binding domain-containing protein n=1 Tax=Marinobacter oulmenensis TaxID=643747 RepID=UPI00160B0E58
MDLKALELFCTVARELSITLAAQRLGRAPSNVTTRIQQLESELGVSLFLRKNKRLHLSPEGEQFLVYAQKILSVSEEARQILHPDKPGGSLRIGAMESTAASRLPEALASYHRKWPEVALSVTTGPSAPMLEAVQARSVDCAFIAPAVGTEGKENSELSSMGLVGQPVFREELMLVLPEAHPPITSAADVAVGSLATFRPGCTYRSIAEEWFRKGGVNPSSIPNIQEVGSYHGMIACVCAGTSACVIPKSVIELLHEPVGIQQIPLKTIDTWLVWRENYDTPALRELISILSGAHATQGR